MLESGVSPSLHTKKAASSQALPQQSLNSIQSLNENRMKISATFDFTTQHNTVEPLYCVRPWDWVKMSRLHAVEVSSFRGLGYLHVIK